MPIDEGFRGGDKVNVPNPDPSLLTTQNLRDGLANLKELIGARLDAMDTATSLRLQAFDRVPADTHDQIGHLKEVVGEKLGVQNEKFRGIAKQFEERDVRTAQASGAADDALKAALQAAKELVGAQGEASAAAAVKSETSFAKQVDQIGTILQTTQLALDARITELKERIDRGEGSSSGAEMSINSKRQDNQLLISVIGALLLLVSLAIAVFVATHK